MTQIAVQPIIDNDSQTSCSAAALAVARCVGQTASLLTHHRLHQPRQNVGRLIYFGDGTSAAVYRETVIDCGPVRNPAFLAVSFRLRLVRQDWSHAVFRAESLLNTVLFAGFPGLVSKLWLRHDRNGVYRGLYEWDGADLALRYARALWRVLALVSVRGSIHYVVEPGLRRDEVLSAPAELEGLPGAEGAWWRPVAAR